MELIKIQTNELNKLPGQDVPSLGRVYVIQFEDQLKIGASENVKRRIHEWSRLLSKQGYGDKKIVSINYSEAHSNFYENEGIIHRHFKDQRINSTELFNLDLKEAATFIQTLTAYDFSKDLQEDEKNQEELSIYNSQLIRFWTLGNPIKTEYQQKPHAGFREAEKVVSNIRSAKVHITLSSLWKKMDQLGWLTEQKKIIDEQVYTETFASQYALKNNLLEMLEYSETRKNPYHAEMSWIRPVITQHGEQVLLNKFLAAQQPA